jgi:hypothetical protein
MRGAILRPLATFTENGLTGINPAPVVAGGMVYVSGDNYVYAFGLG